MNPIENIFKWFRNYRLSVSEPPIISLEGIYTLLLLLGLSLVAVCFHLVRILYNAPVDFSMDWNLFLSWIPLIVAFLANNISIHFRQGRLLLAVLSVFWLAFFPNAPYMITDLSHLVVDFQRDLTWHDNIMLFTYAEVSLFNGLVSLYWIHSSWKRVYHSRVSWLLLLGSFPLAGYGVYLGRVRRMNSWDILHDPHKIMQSLVDSLMDRTALLLSLEIGALLAVLYLVLWSIIRFRIRFKASIEK
ncbi:putative membrane protein [Dyadobacter jejuensis]|uniref:Putative membrane protein n=1 Tax=Dyadobacter jejuensis TaxID=1082580 RepID=A0A316AGB3_9BACT|nr:DUF1361 domain-containing protein [Dyadobacter jejuensis]PWJ56000.1 putative membrane protein [Dyadobacter jejuensis]